ncbi:MAG: epimerase, partial [Paracoccaceae bacterium]|nr:epimerase [Paracoccaceae bacterium]
AQEMCAEMVAHDQIEARRHALLRDNGLDMPIPQEGN